MPQSTQHSLIHVLLLWITILSIIQIVFITLFFTAGHHDLSQNCSAVAAGHAMQIQPNNRPSQSPSELLLGEGKMLTFKGTEGANGKVKWVPKNPSKGLIEEEGEVLTITKDGYYFLNLQVTMKGCDVVPFRSDPAVSLEWRRKPKDLLQGWINNNTCSTGLLGKVVELSAGDTLVVTINLPNTDAYIDDSESLTHLDIIYMHKP